MIEHGSLHNFQAQCDSLEISHLKAHEWVICLVDGFSASTMKQRAACELYFDVILLFLLWLCTVQLILFLSTFDHKRTGHGVFQCFPLPRSPFSFPLFFFLGSYFLVICSPCVIWNNIPLPLFLFFASLGGYSLLVIIILLFASRKFQHLTSITEVG